MFESANNLILKVTKGCNLNCSYCYVKHKEENKNVFMDFDTFTSVIERVIKDKIKSGNKVPIKIVFHGGEPLTLGINRLSKMLKYINTRFNEKNLDFSIGMQTNLTLLNEDLAALLSKYNVHIGASFDGLKKGNIARTTLFKSSYFLNKFRLMDRFNIDYGLLMVVGNHNYKNVKKSADFISKKLGKSFKINYAQDVNNIGGEVDGKTFFKYAVKPFIDEFIKKGYIKEGNTKQYIKTFLTERLVELYNKPSTNCGGKVCGAGLNIIEVNPDGEAELCGRFAETTDESYIDDISKRDFLRLKQYKKYFWFANIKHEHLIKNNCDICYADELCDHGCMAFHFVKYGEFGIRTDLVCDFYKELYKYLIQNEKRIIDKYLQGKGNIIDLGGDIKKVKTNTSIYKYIEEKGFKLELKNKIKGLVIKNKE